MLLIWRRIFPGHRRRLLLAALPWCDDVFADSLVWPTVRASVERLIYTKSSRGDAIRRDVDAANMVLWAAFSVCKAECTSGYNHVYRSLLSIRGNSYRELAQAILNELAENGFMTLDDVDFEIGELNREVAGAG